MKVMKSCTICALIFLTYLLYNELERENVTIEKINSISERFVLLQRKIFCNFAA